MDPLLRGNNSEDFESNSEAFHITEIYMKNNFIAVLGININDVTKPRSQILEYSYANAF